MSTTLRIVNGQLDINQSTGQLVTVSGNRKAGQDMAEALLQDYLADIDYGSYLRAITSNQIPFAGDLFIRYYIANAIQKLQGKQQDDVFLTLDEQIVDITQLLVNTDQKTGTTYFYVSVSTGDEGKAEVGAVKAPVPTQLEHQYERF